MSSIPGGITSTEEAASSVDLPELDRSGLSDSSSAKLAAGVDGTVQKLSDNPIASTSTGSSHSSSTIEYPINRTVPDPIISDMDSEESSNASQNQTGAANDPPSRSMPSSTVSPIQSDSSSKTNENIDQKPIESENINAGSEEKDKKQEDEIARQLSENQSNHQPIESQPASDKESSNPDNNHDINDDITQTPPTNNSRGSRVKVYQLNSSGNWDDKGTGYVQVFSEIEEPEIVVISEENPNVILLSSTISLEEVYQKQQDTLIVWNETTDSDLGIDLALSFQEITGCAKVWDHICAVQNRLKPRYHRLGAPIPQSNSGSSFDDLFCKSDDEEDDYGMLSMILPAATPKNLEEILHVMSENFVMGKQKLTAALLKENYIVQLCDLFKMLEDMEATTDLKTLFEIFRIYILLNHPILLDKLFHPNLIFQVVGVFEYDPELPRAPRHREFLEKTAVFHQVVHLPESLVELIHKNYRMHYMKDVVLPRVLDDSTHSTLISLIYASNARIVNEIRREPHILDQLFGKMKNPACSQNELKDLLRFLNELCELAKSSEAEPRTSFYTCLDEHGLFDVLQRTLVSSDAKMRLITAELLVSSVDTIPRLLRRHILNKTTENDSLMSTIVKQLQTDDDTAVNNLLFDLLRYLVDIDVSEDLKETTIFMNGFFTYLDDLLLPITKHKYKTSVTEDVKTISSSDALNASNNNVNNDNNINNDNNDINNGNINNNKMNNDDSLSKVHEHHSHHLHHSHSHSSLLDVFIDDPKNMVPVFEPLSDAEALLLMNLLEFVGFLLTHHGNRAKIYVLTYGTICKTNALLLHPDKHIALASLRLLKLVLKLKDKALTRSLIRDNFLERVVKIFLKNSDKYNLINSACLELFTIIQKDDSKSLTSYFVNRFYDQVKHITYTETFNLIKFKYDETRQAANINESSATGDQTPILGSSSGRTGLSRLQLLESEKYQRMDEESAYFEQDDEDEVRNSWSPSATNSNDLRDHSTSPLGNYTYSSTNDLYDNRDSSSPRPVSPPVISPPASPHPSTISFDEPSSQSSSAINVTKVITTTSNNDSLSIDDLDPRVSNPLVFRYAHNDEEEEQQKHQEQQEKQHHLQEQQEKQHHLQEQHQEHQEQLQTSQNSDKSLLDDSSSSPQSLNSSNSSVNSLARGAAEQLNISASLPAVPSESTTSSSSSEEHILPVSSVIDSMIASNDDDDDEQNIVNKKRKSLPMSTEDEEGLPPAKKSKVSIGP